MRWHVKKSHRRTPIRGLAVALICLLLAMPWTALAAAAGAIEIHCGSEGQAIAGATFALYRVADAQYAPVGAFEGCSVDLKVQTAEEWRVLAETLAGYAVSATRDAQGTTDAQGALRFEGLASGLYLLTGEELSDGVNTWLAAPALVFVDGDEVVVEPKEEVVPGEKVDLRVIKVWKDKGNEAKRPKEIAVRLYRGQELIDTVALNAANNWRYTWKDLPAGDWRVVETTRVDGYTVTSSHEGSEYVITNSYTVPGKPPTDGKLPQTGQLWWPVPMLAVVGMALVLFGWIRHKRGEN